MDMESGALTKIGNLPWHNVTSLAGVADRLDTLFVGTTKGLVLAPCYARLMQCRICIVRIHVESLCKSLCAVYVFHMYYAAQARIFKGAVRYFYLSRWVPGSSIFCLPIDLLGV